MKHIIMFKGGVETLEFFSVEIAKYFEKIGHKIFWYNLFLSENSFEGLLDYYNFHKKDEFVALTFNFEGLEGEAGLYQSDKALDGLHNEHTSRWNFWDIISSYSIMQKPSR